MALTTDRIIGQQLIPTINNVQTLWQQFDITIRDNTENATASDSSLDEVVRTTQILDGTCTGFLGAVNHGGTLPAKGDLIDDLSVNVGTDSVLPSLTEFTNIRVTEVSYNFKQGPATFRFKFRSGVLN